MNFPQLERERERERRQKRTLKEMKNSVRTLYHNSVDQQGVQQKKRSHLALLSVPVVPLLGNMQSVWTWMNRHRNKSNFSHQALMM